LQSKRLHIASSSVGSLAYPKNHNVKILPNILYILLEVVARSLSGCSAIR